MNFPTFNQSGGTYTGDFINNGPSTYNFNGGTLTGNLTNYGTANFSGNFTPGGGSFSNYGIVNAPSATINVIVLITMATLTWAKMVACKGKGE